MAPRFAELSPIALMVLGCLCFPHHGFIDRSHILLEMDGSPKQTEADVKYNSAMGRARISSGHRCEEYYESRQQFVMINRQTTEENNLVSQTLPYPFVYMWKCLKQLLELWTLID